MDKLAKKLYMKKYREQNNEAIKQYQAEYRDKNREKLNAHKRESKTYRALRLKYSYNMTVEDYNNMLESQQGKCLICDKHYTEVARQYLCVDHCHKTGKVRGLLCHNCNSALGLIKEDENILNSMKSYLVNYC